MTAATTVRGVVLNGTGGVWRVRTESGDSRDARLRGRLKQDQPLVAADTPFALKLAVGDDVMIEPGAPGDAWTIAEILPRRSQLARRAPGGRFGERIVAANIDQVIIVFAAANPEPHLRMLDRFLLIAEANQLAARILVNKVDLVGEGAALERFGDYARAGYPVHATSVKAETGLQSVHAMLGGRTSVFTGPSGAGKSSLLNALFPGLDLRVGAISESVNKGRHTTVGAQMIPLVGRDGGYVIDTPGLREVGTWAFPAANFDRCFPEFRPYIGSCRFADCTHTVEPECQVKGAVDAGTVSRERYESYKKLLGELVDERSTH